MGVLRTECGKRKEFAGGARRPAPSGLGPGRVTRDRCNTYTNDYEIVMFGAPIAFVHSDLRCLRANSGKPGGAEPRD